MATALIKDSIVHTTNDFTKLSSFERKGRLIKGKLNFYIKLLEKKEKIYV